MHYRGSKHNSALDLLHSLFQPTYLDEDDGGSNVHETVELAQDAVFLRLGRTVHEHLRYATHGELLDLELDLICAGREGGGVLEDSIGESGREQKDLDGGG